ncbi:MAG: hypothetical protein QG656_2050 [Candidatus Hydrogenedentes bacterium]|nr:hypothetical protein [Candidatus Hydrogenedentota bacterium]
MTAAWALCLLVLAQSNPVETVLDAHPALLENHEGYLRFLRSGSGTAAAERAYLEPSTLLAFDQAASAFDEALLASPKIQALQDRFYKALAGDTPLREAVDALYRWELGQAHDRDILTPALFGLRAQPDLAIDLLQSPFRSEAPADAARGMPVSSIELRKALRVIKSDPVRQQELLTLFTALHELPLAHTEVFPWWQAVANSEDAAAQAYRDFHAYLVAHAGQFWVVHRHEVALAGDPHMLDWLRYWRRLIRRTPGLGQDYAAYVKRAIEQPEADSAADAKPWPPTEPSPALSPIPAENGHAMPLKSDLMPPRAEKPAVPKPEMPTMPERPEKPEKPKPVLDEATPRSRP